MKHSIVTKTGDDGKTFLLAGVRIPKNHIRVKSYGECDELNSILGLCQSFLEHDEISDILAIVQKQIFELSAILATPNEAISEEQNNTHTGILEKYRLYLEKNIQQIEPKLPELKNFILPGGNKAASYIHLARTICRRVERTIIDLSDLDKVNKNFISYFNRLSDLLFILARRENQLSKIEEKIWISGKI